MKRNFLLLLLLTLLPVAGWAQGLAFKVDANDDYVSEVNIPFGQESVTVTVWNNGDAFTYRTGIGRNDYFTQAAQAVLDSRVEYTLQYREGTTGNWSTVTDAFQSGSSFQVTRAGYYRVTSSFYDRYYNEVDKVSSALPVKIEGTDANPTPVPFDLSVTPVNISQTKAYGVPFVLDTDMLTTNRDEVNANADLKDAILAKLQLNDDLSTAPAGKAYYSFGLKIDPTTGVTVDPTVEGPMYKEGDQYLKNVYTIKPSGEGTITVTKATNNDWTIAAQFAAPTYNGEDQALLSSPALSKFGKAVYYVISGFTGDDETGPLVTEIPDDAEWVEYADVVGKNAGVYWVFAKVVETDDYNGLTAKSIGKTTIKQRKQEDVRGYEPTGAVWTFDNTRHDLVVAPTATLIGTYKYYAVNKADEEAEGYHFPNGDEEGDAAKWSTTIPQGINVVDKDINVYWYVEGNNNIIGIEPDKDNVVNATITPATDLTIGLEEDLTKIAGVKDQYFYANGRDIKIEGYNGVIINTNTSTLGVTPTYFIQKKISNDSNGAWGDPIRDNKGNISYIVKDKGTYRVNAMIVGTKNILGEGQFVYLAEGLQAEFEVVTPNVYVTIEASPKVVGVGSLPTPTYTNTPIKWEDGVAEKDKTNYNNIKWLYYYEDGRTPVENPEAGLAMGTYVISADPTTFTFRDETNPHANATFHNVVIQPTTFVVGPSQIEATIASYTGDDALIYGQTTQLKMTYVSGYGAGPDNEKLIKQFNDATWNGDLVATNEQGESFRLYNFTERHGWQQVTMSWALTEDDEYIPLPAGTYTVSANFTDGTNAIIAKTGTWEVKPMNINDTDQEFYVNNIGDNFSLTKEYIGRPIHPTASDLDNIGSDWTGGKGVNFRYSKLAYGTDYSLEYPKDATKNINVADGGEFTIKGIGNFTGEKTLKFNISKMTIDVDPKAAEWAIGSSEENMYEIDYNKLLGNLVGQDKDEWTDFEIRKANGFKDLAVRRVAPVTVGTYPAGLEAYLPEGAAEADNYKFNFETAALKIKKGTITLEFADVTSSYNGNKTPEYEYEFKVIEDKSDLSEVLLDNDNWKTLFPAWNGKKWNVVKNLEKIADEARYEANKEYTLTYKADENPNMTAVNYEVKVNNPTAKLKVGYANITLKPVDKDADSEADAKNKYNNVNSGTVQTVLGGGDFKSGDDRDFTKLIQKINVDGHTVSLVVRPENNRSGFYKNYNVITMDGTWSYNVKEVLALNSDASDLNKINKDGAYKTVELTIKQSQMKKNDGSIMDFVWSADEWHAMVLPFAAKVSDISAAFKYGIVNVVNPDGVSEGNVVFKMPRVDAIIDANTPFCIKVYKDIPDGYVAKFKAKAEADLVEGEGLYYVVEPKAEIVSIPAVPEGSEFDYEFCGTYKQLMLTNEDASLRFLGPNNKWSRIMPTSNAKFKMQPYTGYVDLKGFAGTREISFIFEEEDGSTTSIKAVDFMNNEGKTAEGLYNINGMKVQDASQRGIYIQNGKKFVK